MKELTQIQVVPRNPTGEPAKQMRRSGWTPAIVYGPKIKNVSFALNNKDALKWSASQYKNEIFKLVSKDTQLNNLQVLCKTVDRHPVKQTPLHIDFYAPDMKTTMVVAVPIVWDNIESLSKKGLNLNIIRREMEAECSPANIPESITLDVSQFAEGQSISLQHLPIPEAVKPLIDPEATLASVVAQTDKDVSPDLSATELQEEGEAEAKDGEASEASGEKKETADASDTADEKKDSDKNKKDK